MGTFRSSYSLHESNPTRSGPHFSWFHPGNYLSSTRNVINPFQGTQNNPEGLGAVPIQCIPINETQNNPPIDNEAQPSKPKKPKTSNEGLPKKKGRPTKAKSDNTSTTPSKKGRKTLNFRGYDSSVDGNGNPAPICSCTGAPRQCYRWGLGGWQSACCTMNISEYPLPMSATRPGARTAGRKMSHGAYDKLVQRLGAQGYDFSVPIDLKDHWAKHGTNKFVTIK